MSFKLVAHPLLIIIITCIFFVNSTSCELVEAERQFFNDLTTVNPLFVIPTEDPCAWGRITCTEDSSHVIVM